MLKKQKTLANLLLLNTLKKRTLTKKTSPLKKNGLILFSSLTFLVTIYKFEDVYFYTLCLQRLLRNTYNTLIVILDYKINYPTNHDNPDLAMRQRIHKRSANRIYKLFDQNGGIYIKIGQHLVSLGYVLPVEWVEEMKPLLDKSFNKTTIKEITKIIKQDLNVNFEDLFSEFHLEPLGIASLAQVHLAKLRHRKDDSFVAIKVQHYKVEKMSKIDIKIVKLMCYMIGKMSSNININWINKEITKNLPNELDFRIEARNMETTRKILKNNSFVKIPQLYFYSKRLICMEYVDGVRLDNLEYLNKHKINSNSVSFEINKLFFKMILKHGWMHCDPHTGNILIKHSNTSKKGYELYILDHGLYRSLDNRFRLDFAKLYMSIVQQNNQKIKENCLNLGALNNSYLIILFILTGNNKNSISSNEIIKYLPNLFDMLNNIPRDLIYVFKTFDLLRLLHTDLNCLDNNINYSYSNITRQCQKYIFNSSLISLNYHSLNGIFNVTKNGFKLVFVYFSTFVFDIFSQLGLLKRQL